MSGDEGESSDDTKEILKKKSLVVLSSFEEDEGSSESCSDDGSGDDDTGESCTEESDSNVDSGVYGSGSSESKSAKVKKNKEPSIECDEPCSICLEALQSPIGNPANCDHHFCLDCILMWSKSNNTCPQDRVPFLQINVRDVPSGRVTRRVPVEEVEPSIDIPPEEQQDNTYCEVCVQCNREEELLLCDGCDLGYHLDCLNPPLSAVPRGRWYCPVCARHVTVNNAAQNNRINNRNRNTARQTPRTGASESLRLRISRTRRRNGSSTISALAERVMQQFVIRGSDNEESEDSDYCPEDNNAEPSTSRGPAPAKRKRVAVRKTASTKKRVRKTTTKQKTKGRRKKGGRRTTKKGRKRKTRKRTAAARLPVPKQTPKSRLAQTLGITSAAKSWQLSAPAMKGRSSEGTSSLTSMRESVGVPRFTLTGSNMDLDYISEPESDGDGGSVAVAQRSRTLSSMSGLARRKAALLRTAPSNTINASLNRKNSAINNNELGIADMNASNPTDLLDSIMESQRILYSSRFTLNDARRPALLSSQRITVTGTSEAKGKKCYGGVQEDGNSPSPPPSQPENSSSSGGGGRECAAVGSGGGGISGEASSTNYGGGADDKDLYSCLPPPSTSSETADQEPNYKKNRKREKAENGDSNTSLYSDVEPNGEEPSDDSSDDELEPDRKSDDDDEKGSGAEEGLVIDDSKVSSEGAGLKADDASEAVAESTADGGSCEDKDALQEDSAEAPVVSQSNVPGNLEGFGNFDLEAVSDSDSPELRSPSPDTPSSLSISDDNMGDPEVTSSTAEVPDRVMHNGVTSIPLPNVASSRDVRDPVGLEGLETEIISDNEDISFDDNDIIEEGEIPNENDSSRAFSTPMTRPRVNMNISRAMELNSPSRDFDGEYEEGEIVDDSFKQKDGDKSREGDDANRSGETEQSLDLSTTNDEGKDADEGEQSAGVEKKPTNENKRGNEKENVSPERSGKHDNGKENISSKEKTNRKESTKTKTKNKDGKKFSGDKEDKEKDVAFKKISRSNRDRNYRDNEPKESNRAGVRRRSIEARSRERELREHGRDKLRERDRNRDKKRPNREEDRNRERTREYPRNNSGSRRDRTREREWEREWDKKREPKRKELERYNVRRLINQKEAERKKKDEFGRDVALRSDDKSRSRSRKRSKSGTPKKASRQSRATKKRRRSYSSSSTSSSSSSDSSSSSSSSYSSSSSSSSSSRSRSYSHERKRRRRRRKSSVSRSKSPVAVKKRRDIAASGKQLSKLPKTQSKPSNASLQKMPKEKNKDRQQKKKTAVPEPIEKIKTREGLEPKEKRGRTRATGLVEMDRHIDGDRERRKKKKDRSEQLSKEVYQAGGSIVVSVNFSRNSAPQTTALSNVSSAKRKNRDKEASATEAGKTSSDLPSLKRLRLDAPSSRLPSVQQHSRQNWPPSRSPSGKRTPLQDEPMWSPSHGPQNLEDIPGVRLDNSGIKSPEMGDMDVILVTPPPQEPILISDSEDEGITRLPPDLGVPVVVPAPPRPTGPKTPPEPGVKFTLSNKAALKPISNPLGEEEEERRGPNTPPGPPPESDESAEQVREKEGGTGVPCSPAGTPPNSSPEPDAYDPFEPTKSPSPSHSPAPQSHASPSSPPQEARVSSSDQATPQSPPKQFSKSSSSQVAPQSQTLSSSAQSQQIPALEIIDSPSPTKAQKSLTKNNKQSSSPPPLPMEPPQPEERPPEPKKPPPPPPEEEATSSSSLVVQSTKASIVTSQAQQQTSAPAAAVQSVSTSTPSTTSQPPAKQSLNSVEQLFAGLPANVANILYPAALAAAAMQQQQQQQAAAKPVQLPDLSKPPPDKPNLKQPPPMSGKQSLLTSLPLPPRLSASTILDADSPTSPASSDGSDIFDPPSPTHNKSSPSHKKHSRSHKHGSKKSGGGDKFDNLFGDGGSKKHGSGHKSSKQRNAMKLAKLKSAVKGRDANDEDIPNSAVDLQVKEKFLKKLQRQDRVVEEVKLCLKPYYNKKTIGKDDYKDIMRKCVQKVCNNRSGEINPTKIRELVEGYIKKVKYYRKKENLNSGAPIMTSSNNTAGGNTLNNSMGGSLPPLLPPTVNNPPMPGGTLMNNKGVSSIAPLATIKNKA